MSPTIRRSLAILFVSALFGATLWFVFTKVASPAKIWDLIEHVPGWLLGLLVRVATLMFVFRAVRMRLLLSGIGIDLSPWQAAKVFVAGQALSPLPAGEGSRSVLVNLETGHEVAKTVTPLLLLGFIEFISALLLAIVGSVRFAVLRVPALAGLALLAVVIALVVNESALRTFLKWLPRHPHVTKAKEGIKKAQVQLREGIFGDSWLPNAQFLTSLGLATVTNLLGGAIVLILARYYAVGLGFWEAVFVFSSAIVFTELLPFMPAGIGATEGGMGAMLALAGVAAPTAVAIVVMFRLVTLVYAVLLGSVFFFSFYAKAFFSRAHRK